VTRRRGGRTPIRERRKGRLEGYCVRLVKVSRSWLICIRLLGGLGTVLACTPNSSAPPAPKSSTSHSGESGVADSLDGKSILVILLSARDPEQVYLLSGIARTHGSLVVIAPYHGGAIVSVSRRDIEQNGFAPTVLPRLVAEDKYLPLVDSIARQNVWCVPVLSDSLSPEATPVPGLLGGVAVLVNGQILLRQVR
jgi:hypothetical protein